MTNKSTAHRMMQCEKYSASTDEVMPHSFCVICGQNGDELTQDCPGLVPRYQAKNFSNFFCSND